MTKFRVLQIGEDFYPQRKILFWCYEGDSYTISFPTLEEAYDYIDKTIKMNELSKQRKVHKYPPEGAK